MIWHHPSYYKKLRAERKKIPVSGTLDRATGSADNLNAENSERFVHRASSVKHQAPRAKQQASSSSNPSPKRKAQASSPE